MRLEVEIARTALGVETPGNRQSLDERRLSGTILTDEEGHFRVKLDLIEPRDRG